MNWNRTKTVFVIMILGTALIFAFPVQAQDPTPSDDDVNAVAKELYCPVCENIPLDVCATQACEQWRGIIRDKLSEGWTEEQIKQYFVDQYGDRVLAEPPKRGLNWLVYIVPPLAFLGGAYLLYNGIQQWRVEEDFTLPEEKDTGPADDEYIARLEEELRNR